MFDLAYRPKPTYISAYAHLDKNVTLGEFRVTEHTATSRDEEDPCDPYTHVWHVEVFLDEPENTDEYAELVKKALRQTLTHAGCTHDWDCCGCRSTYATEVTQIAGTNKYTVTGSSSRNY